MKAVENDEDYILRFPCDISLKFNPLIDTKFEKNKLKWNAN